MTVDKDEFAAVEVDSVIGQVEEGGVVEVGVGLAVDVQVPVLVVHRRRGLRVETRKEGRVGQVELRDPEVLADVIADFVFGVSEILSNRLKCMFPLS